MRSEKIIVYRETGVFTRKLSLIVKRAIDLFFSAFLLIALSPLIIIIGLLIKATSPGPVIYKQTRLGLRGKAFTMYKFRSMRIGAEAGKDALKNEAGGLIFKIKHDPRITPVGRYLRRFSLDELPQFLNILKGDMSLVGPRPPLPEEVKEYGAWEQRRLSVTPGLTGLWQVSGRSSLDYKDMVRLDYLYIQSWSLWLDFKILWRTLPAVLSRRGAY